LRFTPRIALRARAPWAIFLDLRETEPALGLKIQVTLERLGIAPHARGHALGHASYQFAWGEHPSQALIAAATASPVLSAESIDWLLDPFGVLAPGQGSSPASLQRWVDQLGLLGIRTHADFARLPLKALGSRFGRAGVELARKLEAGRKSALPELWPVFVPPQKIFEQTDFAPDDPIPAAHEPLLFVARPILDKLCLRLKARSLRATALALTLEIRNRDHVSVLRLSQPQGSVTGLFPLFQEHLRQWIAREMQKNFSPDGSSSAELEISVPPGVTRLHIEVTETAPGGLAQRDLFHQLDDLSENWDSLIGRLQQRLGEKAAFFATPTRQHLPEQGWTARSPETLLPGSLGASLSDSRIGPPAAGTATDIPRRPSRLLKRTVPIALVHGHHTGNNPGGAGTTRSALRWPARPSSRPSTNPHTNPNTNPNTNPKTLHIEDPVRDVQGPERIMPPAQHPERLYYRIHCLEGPMLWAYTHEELPFAQLTQLHLQGYFD